MKGGELGIADDDKMVESVIPLSPAVDKRKHRCKHNLKELRIETEVKFGGPCTNSCRPNMNVSHINQMCCYNIAMSHSPKTTS